MAKKKKTTREPIYKKVKCIVTMPFKISGKGQLNIGDIYYPTSEASLIDLINKKRIKKWHK